MEYFSTAISAIKEAGPKMYTAAFFVSLFVFLAPAEYLAMLGLTDVKRDYGIWIGATLLITGGLLLAQFLFGLANLVRRHMADRRFSANIKQSLTELTGEEKDFLRRYILGGENTIYASIYDGIPNGIHAKDIVYRASNLSVPGSPGHKFPYNLQPHARQILLRSPKLLH